MPCLWLQHNKSQIFLNVGIVDANTVVDLVGGNRPDIQNNMFTALLDTGAQVTAISKRAADKLGLRPIGKVPIQGVGGLSYHNNYFFQVAMVIPIGEQNAGKIELAVHIFHKPIEGVELNIAGDQFDVLLGMDIISNCSLAIEGNGTFSLSF